MRDLDHAQWRKSRRSGAGNACVEVAALADGSRAIRDSKDPSGPVLTLNPTTPWQTENEEPALIVRILPLAPKVLPYALGYALAAEPDWIHAVVFDDRIEAVHNDNRVAYASVLGSAIAHEVTHMLLKSPKHAIRGVMRARWDRRDLLDIACGRLTFNPEEEKLILRAVLQWLSAHRRT